MTPFDPSQHDGRTDEWRLSAGGTVYAPVHPLHLPVPGFWDEVQIAGQIYSKLLCVSFVLERADGLIELFPYLSYWYWYPDRIEARYYLVIREGLGYKQQAGVRVFIDEVRSILPDGTLSCAISFDLLKEHPAHLHVVAWGRNAQLSSTAGQPITSQASATATAQVVPQLEHTPFMEMLLSGGLTGDSYTGPDSLNARHWHIALDENAPVSLQVNCRPR